MKSRRDGEVSPKMLSQMMRQLDVIIWEALRCYTADDVVKKFLLEDMHPPMQSCIHFADDTEEIWCSSRKNLGETAVEEAKAAKAAANNLGSAKDDFVEEEEQKKNHIKKAAHKEVWKPHMTEDQVLPISLQLRPFPRTKPKNVFRLFFVENELVAATPICIWSYYSQIHLKRDSVAKQLKEFACNKDTTQFVHAYFLKSNQRLINAVGVAEYNFDAARRILIKQDKDEATEVKNQRDNFSGGTDSAQAARVKSREGRNGPGIRPLFVPPQDALFDTDIYTPDGEGLQPEKVIALHTRYPFLNKSSQFKPWWSLKPPCFVRRSINKALTPEEASGVPLLPSRAGLSQSSYEWRLSALHLLGEDLYALLIGKYVDKKEERDDGVPPIQELCYAEQLLSPSSGPRPQCGCQYKGPSPGAQDAQADASRVG